MKVKLLTEIKQNQPSSARPCSTVCSSQQARNKNGKKKFLFICACAEQNECCLRDGVIYTVCLLNIPKCVMQAFC